MVIQLPTGFTMNKCILSIISIWLKYNDSPIGDAVTVIVFAITYFRGTGIDIGVTVITVAIASSVSVAV